MADKDIKALKEEADALGIEYATNISYGVLEKRINDFKNKPKAKKATKVDKRKEATKLIRCTISCNNPNKKEHQGEYVSVGNAVIGQIKKFVAFNVPYHVPQIILDTLKDKRFQRVYTRKEGGKNVVKTKIEKEYVIDILEPLSKTELKDLAQRQAAKGIMDE